MSIRHVSLMLPCSRLEDFPSHLAGERAAGLLAAWTALWHPSLLAATGALPGWHPADNPPDPSELSDELVLVPSAARQRLASDWLDRFRAASSIPAVETSASRVETIAAALRAASIEPELVPAEIVADFLALGHAHLQVELLTRAMRYTSVLDTEQFASAVVAAAGAAVSGKPESAREELARAFDLLNDARNHVYAVDFYVIDLTLVASSTLGDALLAKLTTGSPTSVLITGELLEQMADQHPQTLIELQRAITAGTATVVGGPFRKLNMWQSPEAVLAEIERGQRAAEQHLGRRFEIFGQFTAAFPPILPPLLAGAGFRGALHAAFDGSRLPKAEQCKTWWGPAPGFSIEALATTPLDVDRPETWLRLAERIGDTIAHDHVATIVLAGWPGTASDYYEDLRRAARYGPVLGKLVTLEEYFRVTREPDEWSTFDPREYPDTRITEFVPNAISSRVDAYRRDVLDVHRRLAAGLIAAAGLTQSQLGDPTSACSIALNAWNFSAAQYIDADPLNFGSIGTQCLPDVPECGYSALATEVLPSSVALVEGRTLRNELLELTVNKTTGGIQSLRLHRDRGTRASQRLVFHRGSSATPLESQMVADEIEITRNDNLVGEITSRGRLLDSSEAILTRFTQTVRVVRGLPAAIVDVLLEPERLPDGDSWTCYYASRLALSDEALSFRRGVQWTARESRGPHMESPEWIEAADGIGAVCCFGLGLALHRQAGPAWLDTLLVVAGEERRHFQFALAIDDAYPTQTALKLLTAGRSHTAELPAAPPSAIGWFLHVDSNNVLITHIETLAAPRNGLRLRLLETEGRAAQTTLAAYRAFHTAQTTDFRGNSTAVLSVVDGRVRTYIDAHRWIQIEAEW